MEAYCSSTDNSLNGKHCCCFCRFEFQNGMQSSVLLSRRVGIWSRFSHSVSLLPSLCSLPLALLSLSLPLFLFPSPSLFSLTASFPLLSPSLSLPLLPSLALLSPFPSLYSPFSLSLLLPVNTSSQYSTVLFDWLRYAVEQV